MNVLLAIGKPVTYKSIETSGVVMIDEMARPQYFIHILSPKADINTDRATSWTNLDSTMPLR